MRIVKLANMALLIVFFTACSQAFTGVPRNVKKAQEKDIRAVVLPFAVYTADQSLYGSWRLNEVLQGAVRDTLYRKGWSTPSEEHVVEYLFSRNIIVGKEASLTVSPATHSIQNEMSGEWTSDMNLHFERTVLQNVANANSDLLRDLYNQESVALESLAVKDLGRAFGADYVIRGRLTMYSLGQSQTYYTKKTGPLRFFFRFGQRTFVGMSQARHYENYGSINREVRLDSLFEDESGGLAGDPVDRIWLAGEVKPLGLLTVIVQDAATGDIVWLKRTNIETMAIYSSTQIVDNHDALQAQGIRRAARQLTGMLTR